jgi:ABC-type transport system substrate-binding protein
LGMQSYVRNFNKKIFPGKLEKSAACGAIHIFSYFWQRMESLPMAKQPKKTASPVVSGLLLYMAALTLFFSGCVKKDKGNLNVVNVNWPAAPVSLHPANHIVSGSLYIFEYTQKTLSRTDMRDNSQVPVLIKQLPTESADGLSMTYDLRDDVRWDDGSPFTTDDVIFSLKASKCVLTDNAERRDAYDNVNDVTTDPQLKGRVIVHLGKPNFGNKTLLNELYIMQKKVWDPKGTLDKFSMKQLQDTAAATKYPEMQAWATSFNDGKNGKDLSKLHGLGPYAVATWNESNIILERKKNWWGEKDTLIYDKSYPDKIIFSFIADDNAQVQALINGKVDVVTTLSTASYNKMAKDSQNRNRFYFGMTDQVSVNLLMMNMRPEGKHLPFFTDQRVRRAIALLSPVDEINKTLVMNQGTRQPSFIPPSDKMNFNDTLKLLAYDQAKAIALLEAAGWRDTDGDGIRDKMIDGKKVAFRFTLTFPASGKNIVALEQSSLAKAGIAMEPKLVDQGSLSSDASLHDFDMLLITLSGGVLPEDPAQMFSLENWTSHGMNYTGFGNDYAEDLIKRANLEMDPAGHARLLKMLQAEVYKEQPFVYLYGVKRKFVVSKKFEQPGFYVERPGIILNALKLKD